MADKLRVVLFEQNFLLASLIEQALRESGHQLQICIDTTVCPVCRDDTAVCSKQRPCADVMICDFRGRGMSGLDLFKLQRARGCKALDRNKAILTDLPLEPDAVREIDALGCELFKRPARVYELMNWVDKCSQRSDSLTV
ncbi:MAG: hypothetical protein C0616_08540 [Desulfuromonas sp.]|nr:MAG: hypothetical protein C0616_08540 [Desulfuromonas sp.]